MTLHSALLPRIFSSSQGKGYLVKDSLHAEYATYRLCKVRDTTVGVVVKKMMEMVKKIFEGQTKNRLSFSAPFPGQM